MNQLQMIGFVGQDSKIKEFPSGKSAISFSVADNYTYTDQNGEKTTETTWFQCLIFGTTEYLERLQGQLKSGLRVFVQGSMSASAYLDKDNKVIPTVTVIVARIEYLFDKKSKEENPETTSGNYPNQF